MVIFLILHFTFFEENYFSNSVKNYNFFARNNQGILGINGALELILQCIEHGFRWNQTFFKLDFININVEITPS
jgi:hypothetical protein